MNAFDELAASVRDLPEVVRESVAAALISGDFTIGAGAWESELAMCPIAAGAVTAEVWRDGGICAGAEEWGTPAGPSPAVEEFAAWFDISAEEAGLTRAIDATCRALDLEVGVSLRHG